MTVKEAEHDGMEMSAEEWLNLGEKLFGPNKANWIFKCPACGVETKAQEWIDADAKEAAGYSCIGRYVEGGHEAFTREQPCKYAGGGLFNLNPIKVIFEDGESLRMFGFANEDS